MLEVLERDIPITRGVIDKKSTASHLKIRQFSPRNSSDVPWLEHIWSVQWDLPGGKEHVQRTVPFPAFNVVADRHRGCALFGCSTEYFEYLLKGTGQVVGFRFCAAAQSAFWAKPASELSNGFLPSVEIFAPPVVDALNSLAKKNVSKRCIAKTLTQLALHAAPISSAAKAVGQMVRLIERDPDIYRVGELSEFFNISERSIQRQFASHLGLSPKLVIDRSRMHNALDALHSGSILDFSDLALRLNYFDQSHFTNAFKRMTGFSPANYPLETPDRQ